MKKIQAYFEPDNPALTDEDLAFRQLIGGYREIIDQVNNEEKPEPARSRMIDLLNGYEAAFYSIGWKVEHKLVPEEEIEE